ncbi:MAG: hypothetical protein ACOYXT_08245 [Bacteroidota bacterium]
MTLRLFILLFLISCSADNKNSVDSKELVGIWQAIPEIASGWADTYRFWDNGEFIFHYSQMICDNRTLDYSGTWELTGTENLKLTIKSKTVLEGGKLEPAMGSCGSDYEIVGGEVKEIKLDRVEVQDIRLSVIALDNKHVDMKTRTVDGRPFWKMDNDPTKY